MEQIDGVYTLLLMMIVKPFESREEKKQQNALRHET